MASSMTAFTSIEDTCLQGTFSWEIKTVNHRYLELHFNLPEALQILAPVLRQKVTASLSRGKVTCTLKLFPSESSVRLQVNNALLKELNRSLNVVSEAIPCLQPASAMEILQWPGLLKQDTINYPDAYRNLLSVFDTALENIISARKQEGSGLQHIILQRMDAINDNLACLRKYIPETIAAQKQKIAARFQQLSLELDSVRLEHEVVLLLQKIDITEEIDRLSLHVSEVKRIFNDKNQKATGRRLDFLMQELNREANTITAKSVNISAIQAAVDIKVMVEQAREQIQNIE